MGTAPANAGGLRRLRARGWMAVPAVLVLLAAAVAGMDAADDDARPWADPETAAADVFPTDDSPATTDLEAEPVGTGGAGAPGSGRATATLVRTGRATSTASSPTPTTQPGSATPGPTSTTQPGSSPSPSESDPPDLSGLRAGELPDGDDRIFEDGACGGPTTISVEALATDESGIRSVTLYWSFDGASGSVTGATPMSHSGTVARATFGPFPRWTAPEGGVQITWFVEATDGAGNTARAYAPSSPIDERVTLSPCG